MHARPVALAGDRCMLASHLWAVIILVKTVSDLHKELDQLEDKATS